MIIWAFVFLLPCIVLGSPDYDVTGTYQVIPYHTPSARYYLTQDDDGNVFWLGDSNNGGWRNLASGTYTANDQITMNWQDPPPGTNSGTVILEIQDGNLVVIDGTGFDIDSVFTKVEFSSCRDISGIYSVVPYHTASARYHIVQDGENSFRWTGLSNVDGGWRNTVSTGTIDGDLITAPWVDIPPSGNSGQATLRINPDGSLTMIDGDGFYINSVFAKSVVSGIYVVSPYHTDSARYYITAYGDSLTWFGDSHTGAWRNTGSGSIDGNYVTVNWVDVDSTNNGAVTLKYNVEDQTLIVDSGTGFDQYSVFTRQTVDEDLGITGIYYVAPYHTPEARYYVTQTTATDVFWFGDSRNGGWRNFGVGVIDADCKSVVTFTWTDLPPSGNNGKATFIINSDRSLTVIDGTGFDIGADFIFDDGCALPHFDITGTYQVQPYHTPSARYYIASPSAGQVVWYGNSNNGGWRNTAEGTINGNQITVNWQDPPPGTNSGTVVLEIQNDGTLLVTDGTGFDINSVFSKVGLTSDRSISGVFKVSPYHTPEATYAILQDSDNSVVWYGNSNNGGWRNTATGKIDGNKLHVAWEDIPPSENSGETEFLINSDGTLVVTSGDGFETGAVFSQAYQIVSGEYTADSRTIYISKVGETVNVLGQEDGSFTFIGSGAIFEDKAYIKVTNIESPADDEETLLLVINPDRTFTVLCSTYFDQGTTFYQGYTSSDSLNSITGSYQTDASRYDIYQVDDNLFVWQGFSNSGEWTTAKGAKVEDDTWVVYWKGVPPSSKVGCVVLKYEDHTFTVVTGNFEYASVTTVLSLQSDPEAMKSSGTTNELTPSSNGLVLILVSSGFAVAGVIAVIIGVVIYFNRKSAVTSNDLTEKLF